MSHLTKLEFNALDISGENYLSRILNAEIQLDVMGFSDTIKIIMNHPFRIEPRP